MDALMIVLLEWLTPVLLFLLTAGLFYLYVMWPYSTWSRLGVPGPKPSPFLGNAKDFNEKGFHAYMEWTKKYGKNVGIYMTRTPVLLTADLEVMKEILVKDFQNFSNRGLSSNDLLPPVFTNNLINSKDGAWRRQRHTLLPTFSAKKLKMMGRFITYCCHNLVKSIEMSTDAGTLLDVKTLFGSYTLDVIAGTGFGIETNSILEGGNEFLDNVKVIFNSFQLGTLPIAIAATLPALAPVMKKLGFYSMKMKETNFVTDAVRSIIAQKKQSGQTSEDMMQLMLDAEANESEVNNSTNQKVLSRDEIVAEGLVFFIAGYDTTATTLQFLSYLLARNPEKQEKLYREIVAAIGDAEPTYDNVMEIAYLDCCIRETLRLFPPGPAFDRFCSNTRTINGITIPAGACILINVASLMKDETYFPNPEEFIPERFQDETRPIPALARDMMFGAGPRHCIGMRLALFEAKMAAVSVFRKFRFVKVKETVDKIIPKPGGRINVSMTPILIGSERR